jgi:hypothetical protein
MDCTFVKDLIGLEMVLIFVTVCWLCFEYKKRIYFENQLRRYREEAFQYFWKEYEAKATKLSDIIIAEVGEILGPKIEGMLTEAVQPFKKNMFGKISEEFLLSRFIRRVLKELSQKGKWRDNLSINHILNKLDDVIKSSDEVVEEMFDISLGEKEYLCYLTLDPGDPLRLFSNLDIYLKE